MRDSNWILVWHKLNCAVRKPRGFCDCGLVRALDGKFANWQGEDYHLSEMAASPSTEKP